MTPTTSRLDEVEPAVPTLARALAYWHERRGDRSMPARTNLDPVDIPQLLSHVMLLDVLPDPLDFRYRLIGTGVRSHLARDYTGLQVSKLAHQRPPSSVWSLLAAAVARKAPVCARIPYIGPARFVHDVIALFMPLSADGETVDMLLGALHFQFAEPGTKPNGLHAFA